MRMPFPFPYPWRNFAKVRKGEVADNDWPSQSHAPPSSNNARHPAERRDAFREPIRRKVFQSNI